jgi:hypothetical protein
MPNKPDAQTVAQMAATIASGLVAVAEHHELTERDIVTSAVRIARAIVAEVERAEPEEEKP